MSSLLKHDQREPVEVLSMA